MKPKAPEKPRKKDKPMTGVLLTGAAAVAAVMLGVILWLKARDAAAQDRLDGAIALYDGMKKLKQEFLELTGKLPKTNAKAVDPATLPGSIDSYARNAKLPSGQMNPHTPRTAPGWKETEVVFELRAQNKEQSISRAAFIDFLANIERDHPSVKSKNLSMAFAEGPDLKNCNVSISHFARP